MQTQKNKKTALKTALKVKKLRGLLGFYDGFLAAAIRQMACTSIRFSLYDQGKDLEMFQRHPNSLVRKILLASCAGCAACFAGIPLDVINVRMQNDMKLDEHKKRNYKNLIDALIRIRREEGFIALYNGGTAALLKSAIATAGQLVVYDQVKTEMQTRFDMEDDVYLHLKCSFFTAVVEAIISHPFDVLKTVFMNAHRGQFSSIFDATRHIMRFGYLGPYRGLAPSLARKAPATILMFIIYEQLRINLGYLPLESK